MVTDFILFTNSSKSANLLAQIGYIPSFIENINGGAIKKGESPIIYCDRIVYEVATTQNKNALIVFKGIFVGRRLIGIPQTENEMRRLLKLYSGRNHAIYTSVILIKDGIIIKRRTSTRIKIKNFSDEEIENYIASNQWANKIGGYDFDGIFQKFIIKVSGSITGAEGLPCYETANILQKL